MGFFSHRKVKNYSFLKSYDFYLPGWGGVCALAGLLVIGVLIGSLVLILLGLLMSKEAVDTYGLLITYPIQFIPAMIFCSLKSRGNAVFDKGVALDSAHFGRTGGWVLALAVILATISTAYMTDAITKWLPPMPYYLENMLKGMTGGPLWASLLSVSVMAPFFEEWLCRGMIMRGLLQRVRPVWAIVISAAFFAVIHMNPWQAIPAFILGCLFGYVYYKTGSLKMTMLMHCANNTFSVIISRIDAFKDADTWLDVIPPMDYFAGFVAAALIVIGLVLLLRRIPLERPEGNLDPVEAQ